MEKGKGFLSVRKQLFFHIRTQVEVLCPGCSRSVRTEGTLEVKRRALESPSPELYCLQAVWTSARHSTSLSVSVTHLQNRYNKVPPLSDHSED